MKMYLSILLIIISATLYSHGDRKEDEMVEDNRILFNEDDDFTEILIEVTNWDFSMDLIELNKESNYRLIFINIEGHHGIYIPGLEFKTPDLELQQSSIFDFHGDIEGEYTFFCYIPCGKGHKDMVGKIVIK